MQPKEEISSKAKRDFLDALKYFDESVRNSGEIIWQMSKEEHDKMMEKLKKDWVEWEVFPLLEAFK